MVRCLRGKGGQGGRAAPHRPMLWEQSRCCPRLTHLGSVDSRESAWEGAECQSANATSCARGSVACQPLALPHRVSHTFPTCRIATTTPLAHSSRHCEASLVLPTAGTCRTMSTLVLTAAPSCTLQQLQGVLSAQGLGAAEAVAVATGSGGLNAGALAAGSYDTVISVADAPGHHTVALLGLAAASLKPGGRLVVQEPGTPDADLSKALLLSGFTGAAPAPGGGLAATKPSWQTGTKAAIALKPRAAPPAATAPGQANGGAKWTLGALDGDEELVDDEALLTEEDKQRPTTVSADDCEVGAAGRKACKDCTCGRAEGTAPEVKLSKELLDNPTSGCGSCGLGDAFRCGGCPYRGLPSFEMGKKIELPSDFLAMDL